MATSRGDGIQAFESQFPIVATNLRALVSSWLPPAKEPSPVDDEKVIDGETHGRQERVALGAKAVVSQSSTQYQNRMNRKMGISSTNGATKPENNKDTTHAMSNGSGKRKADTSSDSEEDSKTKLVTKLSSKKSELNNSLNKKKNSSSESVPPKPIAQPIQNPSITSPAKPVSPKLSEPMGPSSDGPSVPSNPPSTTSPLTQPLTTTTTKQLEPPASVEDRVAKESQDNPTTETPEEEKKRLKREKKKERKRLRKLEKLETSNVKTEI